ncbi:gp46 recombination endonuclease subunit [Delftia phage PhiW-14]|uniref:Gp46 recombination endonuclease subunit n=1 Tax=Delftia phage PhiW-14 TaxID=665032 RepID=C9DGJ8_BPW14|nr:gp46 recombination endonuclease subunit [Delftia phage PhiW-14]ACV50249.1 gp46 recombination endonuclease subunit [Delftia phage PhiW-14]
MILHDVWAKNFRSIDAMGMSLTYQPGATMVGSLDNGAGKSTLLVHALFYALFDENYSKGSSKTKLVNSQSNKDTLVRVSLTANGAHWVIERGMKPTVFNIIKDGVRIEDEASLKDYQENLIHVIGMDKKAFGNTVALGLDKFVPFVSMSAPDRRSYGEQMMDLTVIGAMSSNNKEQIKLIKAQVMSVEQNHSALMMRIAAAQSIVEVKKKHVTEASNLIQQDIDAIQTEIDAELAARDQLQAQRPALHAGLDAERKKQTAKEQAEQRKAVYASTLDSLKRQAIEVVSMLESADGATCKCCGQIMPEAHRAENKLKLQQRATSLLQGADEADAALKAIVVPEYDHAEAERLTDLFNAMERAIWGSNQKINDLNGRKANLTARLESSQKQVSWAEEEALIESLSGEAKEQSAALQAKTDELEAANAIQLSLADDAVKAQIADQFLPFLNQRVNFYLESLNLFLNIRIDNEFDIKMDAPDRRNQTVHDLSAGQQRRVDLAVLLAWRDVARSTSSCDSNVLILDEILENLSETGVEDFLHMWEAQRDKGDSLYVITQRRHEFAPLFDQSIIFALKDKSTVVVTGD